MDKESHFAILNEKIKLTIDTLIPKGSGVVSDKQLHSMLGMIAEHAFAEGQNYALSNLMTTDQVAEKLGVSLRRVQAIVKAKNARSAVGMQIMGKNPWVFRPEEIEILRPGNKGRPKKNRE